MAPHKPFLSFKWLQTFLKGLIIGFIVLSILFVLNELHFSRIFPIRNVKVYGVNKLDQKELQSLILPFLQNGFFAVNIELIRDRMMLMPWVADLSVRRIWPDRIELFFEEKKPVARWNQANLLSDKGELFLPKQNTIPNNLPQFIGPLGQQLIMYQYFQRIDRLLSQLHVRLKTFELTPYFTWKLTLDNGIIMQVGYKDVLAQLTHFVHVYPKMKMQHTGEIDYIDLRYPNGMAVKWKN